MTAFIIPIEQCDYVSERDPADKERIRHRRLLPKRMKNWLKRRKIEYTFEHISNRTTISEGTLKTLSNGRSYMIGQMWQHNEYCELTIPDELWALQFKLTWL